jgi:hypothetical protein
VTSTKGTLRMGLSMVKVKYNIEMGLVHMKEIGSIIKSRVRVSS